MSDKIEYSRLLMKRSTTTGEVPTVPPITAVTLNQFTPTDIFEGEFFLNSADDLLWIRTENGILPISLSGSTGTTVTPTLDQVLFEGNNTNGLNINVSPGDTIQFQGLDNAADANMIGIDSSGNTVSTSGLTYSNSGNVECRITSDNSTTNNLPRFSAISPAYGSKGQFGIQFGNRSYTDTVNVGYGVTGDSFVYVGGLTNNLNIINAPGTGDTTDNIRLYAGSRPNTSTANLHIQGTGTTKGYVGINTETPTERLDVNGNIKTSGTLEIGTLGTNPSVYGLGIDSNGIVVTGASASNLQSVLVQGNTTGLNDIIVSSGASIIYEYLPTGATSQYLAIDADGRTILTTGVSGSSGTSGINGTSGTSGTSSTGGGAGGTHFGTNLATGWTYNLAITSNYTEIGYADYADTIIAFPFTPSRNVSIQALSVDFYRPNNNTNARFKYLIYDNNDALLLPNNKLVESPELSPGFFAVVQYNVNYTFNAGTTYWLAIACNGFMSGADGAVSSRGVINSGMLTFAVPNQNDGYGLAYKSAISKSSFSSIPSVWVPASPQSFAGDYLLERGYYGATVRGKFPEIRIKTV